jgi:hypothetical protein
MEQMNKHMEQQNLLIKQMNQQLKSGPSQYSATLSKEIRPVYEKFMQDVSFMHYHIYDKIFDFFLADRNSY